MKRTDSLKKFISAGLALLLLLAFPAAAFAADSAVEFNGHYASSKFGFIPSDKDLFRNFKGLMPGDTVTQKVTITNDSRDEIRVYLFGEPEHESVKDLLDMVKITVKVAGGATIVADKASAEWPSNTTYYSLGWFDPGEEVDLLVTMEVPATMGNEFKKAEGVVKWGFLVHQYDDDDDDDDDDDIPLGPGVTVNGEKIPLSPGTGDDANLYIWAGAFVALSVVLAVLIAKRRRHS